MAISSRFDPASLRQGQRKQSELQETQDSFATTNGVGAQANDKNLSRTSGSRMAMDRARNELLKNNPDEDTAAIEWMKAFSYSPIANEASRMAGWYLPVFPRNAPSLLASDFREVSNTV